VPEISRRGVSSSSYPSIIGWHPNISFPAAVDDAIAATKWIAGNAGQLGIDAARLVVGGDSAGGNLAAVVAISARDGNRPRDRGTGADLSRHRLCDDASLASRAGNQNPAHTFRHRVVSRSIFSTARPTSATGGHRRPAPKHSHACRRPMC